MVYGHEGYKQEHFGHYVIFMVSCCYVIVIYWFSTFHCYYEGHVTWIIKKSTNYLSCVMVSKYTPSVSSSG